MTGVDKIRSRLEGLHAAATAFQGRQQRQCHRRLADTTMSSGDDYSWIKVHWMSEGHVKIYSHPPEDGPDGRSEEQHLFVLSVENVVCPAVNLDRLVDIIGERSIPHVEMRKRLDIAGIVKPLPYESPFQIGTQRFDRLVAEYGGPLIERPLG